MLKKLSAILLFCLISALAFAQTAPKQVLSEKDINSFIVNYKQIMEAFDLLGDKYDHIFEGIDTSEGFSAMIKMRSVKVPEEIQNILKKNGLGDNGFEKAMVIIQGTGAILVEEDLENLNAEAGKDPRISEYIKEARAGIKPLKDSINSKDLDLIKSKKAELFKVLNEI
ncbi:MAG: hypothetical protein FWF38_02345 [Spirochaetaceae bacterium]|nr:hypothetical protein [Spirochaetaceae bacterium]